MGRFILSFGLEALVAAWAARRGHYLTKTMLVSFVLLLDLLWFPNGGSFGSIGLYFFISTLYLVLFFEGVPRFAGIALVIANTLGVLLAELAWHGPSTRPRTGCWISPPGTWSACSPRR